MKRKLLALFVLTLAIYLTGYGAFRRSRVEVWKEEGRAYVIFPKGNPLVYYLFRPLTYIDGVITGMRFHIGPHQESR